jgi:hypothetical protein
MKPVESMSGDDDDSEHKENEEDVVDALVAQVDELVSDDDKRKLTALLKEFAEVFVRSDQPVRTTEVIMHRIDTGDARPFRQTLRQQPKTTRDESDTLLKEMIQQGVVEPSSSPWASNVVLVRKKDGSLRWCIDFRQLNALSKKDAYPLPRIDTCMDALNGACWFSA